jgi:hypothetical protein
MWRRTLARAILYSKALAFVIVFLYSISNGRKCAIKGKGGRIDVQNEMDKGSTFTVWLTAFLPPWNGEGR